MRRKRPEEKFKTEYSMRDIYVLTLKTLDSIIKYRYNGVRIMGVRHWNVPINTNTSSPYYLKSFYIPHINMHRIDYCFTKDNRPLHITLRMIKDLDKDREDPLNIYYIQLILDKYEHITNEYLRINRYMNYVKNFNFNNFIIDQKNKMKGMIFYMGSTMKYYTEKVPFDYTEDERVNKLSIHYTNKNILDKIILRVIKDDTYYCSELNRELTESYIEYILNRRKIIQENAKNIQ